MAEERRGGGDVAQNPVDVNRDRLDDMRPEPFQNGEWTGLNLCFVFRLSGVQTKRDDFIYSPDREVLIERLREFHRMADAAAQEAFATTSARPWNVARAQPLNERLIRRVAYRPLDRRWLYNNPHFIDRRRPDLQEVWGDSDIPGDGNVCLYALPGGTGAGPAVWCHGLLPDYHAFRGSYGGYAFPLYDRRPRVAGSEIIGGPDREF